MKIRMKNLNHQPSAALVAHLEEQLRVFAERRQIDEARVTLEHRLEASPAFYVEVHLVTPGPDFTARAADHTLRAALAKVVTGLHEKMEDRGANRNRRLRSNLQEPAALQAGAMPRARR